MNVMTELKPLCYSYIRFSTPDQIKGDSNRRQIDKARAWALDNGYEFDESLTIRDEGKSAYKGAHLKTGNLGKFLLRIKDDDEIPKGSVLYVEAVDRLTRMEFTDAMHLILGLLEKVKLVIPQLLDQKTEVLFTSLLVYVLGLTLSLKGNLRTSKHHGKVSEEWPKKGAYILR